MFERRRLKKELKALCNFIYHNGHDAIYQTEIVKCVIMPSRALYVRVADGRFIGIGSDSPENFHLID